MIKAVFYIALIGGIIYSGVLFGLPYYNYRVFKSDVIEMSKINAAIGMDDEKFTQKILEQAKENNIPIKEENIKLSRDEADKRRRDIMITWSETVDLFGLYQHTYRFKVNTRQ